MNRPNWKLPAILGGVLLVLSGVAYWVELKGKPGDDDEAEQKRVFSLGDKDAFKSVVLRVGVRPIQFDCVEQCKATESGKWTVVLPEPGEADHVNCGSVASSVRTLASSEIVDLSSETEAKRGELFAQYGLSPDQLKAAKQIEVVTGDGKKQIAYFGSTHPMGDKFYVGVEKDGKLRTDRVFLVAAYQRGTFDREPSYFRNRKLTSLASADVVKISLSSKKGKLVLSKDDGRWSLVDSGQRTPADSESVEGLLSSWVGITAKSLDKKAALAGAKETATLEVGLVASSGGAKAGVAKDRAAKFSFYVGPGAKPRFFATSSEVEHVFELDSGITARFEKAKGDFRVTKLLSAIEQFSLTRATLRGKAIVRREGKWKLGDRELDQNKMQKLLGGLSGSKIKSFLKQAPTGEAQGVTITLGDEATAEKKAFVFWKSGKDVYARDRLQKQGDAMLLDPSVADVLPWTDSFFEVTAPSGAKK